MSHLLAPMMRWRSQKVTALSAGLILGLCLVLSANIASAAATFSFTNSTPIAIPDSGPATPYPSNIGVSGLSGNIQKLTVQITTLTIFSCLDNVQLLLVGPAGQNVYLMGYAGGCNQGSFSANILFDDSGPPIPNPFNSSGTYQPTVNSGECPVTFPAPAPAGPYGTTLSGFNGTNPNGSWSLYVFSSCVGGGNSGGSIASWTLNITVPSSGLSVTSAANPNPVAPAGSLSYNVKVNNGGPDPVSNASLAIPLPSGTTFQSITPAAGWSCITPPVNSGGTITCTIGTLSVGSATFIIEVKVDSATPIGTVLSSTVTVSSATFDPNPSDNTATTNVLVAVGSSSRHLADLVPQLRVNPDREFAINEDNRLAYTLIVKNQGQGSARLVYARIPLDPNLEPAYTEFSDPNIWVQRIVSTGDDAYIQLRYPNFDPGKIMTATVFMKPKAGAVSGSQIFTRAKVWWDDDDAVGKHNSSNAVRLSLTPSSNRNDTGGLVQFFTLTASESNSDGSINISGDFYAPHERVLLWYTDKNGMSAGLGQGVADEEGRFSFSLHPSILPGNGSYAIAGAGARSEVIGSIAINVTGSSLSSLHFSASSRSITPLKGQAWLNKEQLVRAFRKFKSSSSS